MRALFLLLVFSCFMNESRAQGGVAGPLNGRLVYLKDIFPTAVQPKSRAGFQGSPFVTDQWLLARLIMPDSIIADSVYIKLNALDKKLHFKDEKGEEMQATIRVNRITIIDENPAWHNTEFRTGLDKDPNAFFQILADGKVQLLKKMSVVMWETKVLGEEDKRSLQLETELYFASGNTLYKPNKKCAALTELFADKKEALMQFISAGELSCNKEGDMRKIVERYNAVGGQ